MRIDFKENTGICIDGKEITLGDSIVATSTILGKSSIYEDNYYFHDGLVLVVVDDQGCIVEIEVRNDLEENMQVFFRDINVFTEEKSTVLEYMSACNGTSLIKEECEYFAEKLGFVFSFDLSEEDVEEMIRESKEDGVYEDMLEDIEKDIYRSKHVGAFLVKKVAL